MCVGAEVHREGSESEGVGLVLDLGNLVSGGMNARVSSDQTKLKPALSE
jgi:hypothetical protein